MSEESPTTTEIVQREKPAPVVQYEDGSGDMMRSSSGFQHAWRVAQMFAASALVPDHLRGHVPDVAVVLLMAWRLNEDPLVMMQHTHIVKGKAGFSAQYVIARANKSGVFKGRIKFRETGKPGAQDYAVTAYATLAETGEEVEFTASMTMAKAEGWTNNSKYQSMPQVMLSYRAATLLVRLNAPDVMLGRSTAEEIDDVEAAATATRAHRPEVMPMEYVPQSPATPPQRHQERAEPPARTAEPPKPQDAPTASQETQAQPSTLDRARLKESIEREEAKLLDLGLSLTGPRNACGIPQDFSVQASKHGHAALVAYLDALRAAYASATAGPDEDLP